MAIHDPTGKDVHLTATQAMKILDGERLERAILIIDDPINPICPKCEQKVYSYQKKQKYRKYIYHQKCLEEKLRTKKPTCRYTGHKGLYK